MGKPYYPDYQQQLPEQTQRETTPAPARQSAPAAKPADYRENFANPSAKPLLKAYILADELLTKRYISRLQQLPVVPAQQELAALDLNKTVRLFHLQRVIYNKQEDNQEKLANVYQALYTCGGSAVLLVDSDGQGVDFYLGVRADDLDTLVTSKDVLQKAIAGNFPGTQISEPLRSADLTKLVETVFRGLGPQQQKAIASVTGIPAFRKQHDGSSQQFIQGLEHLIDAMHGEKYTLVILADPVSQDQLDVVRHSYENLYTQLMPLAQLELTSGTNESQAINEVLTEGISHGISNSLAHMSSVAKSEGTSHTDSKSHTDSTGKTKSLNIGAGLTQGIATPMFASAIGNAGGAIGGALGSVIPGAGTLIGAGVGTLLGEALAAIAGGTMSQGGMLGLGFGYSKTKGQADTKGTADTISSSTTQTTGTTRTTGTTDTTSRSRSYGTTGTQGSSQSQQIHFANKTIQGLMKQIDRQLERLDDCNDLGLWNCAAYVIADDSQTAQVVASTYQSLLRGEDSGTETGAVNLWRPGPQETQVAAYLQKLRHPLLQLDAEFSQVVTPATYISGKELAIAAGLPQQSVPGLPIDTFVPFGREVIWQSEKPKATARLGNIYHMGQVDKKNYVELSLDGLTAHTFVTGSTGSGKSNAVYKLLDNLQMRQIPWLVIEPAKGEYKKVFGGSKKAAVYGTNPYKYPHLLQLNPFSFPEDVHVLEHIDRLVEIFNACWPMYAAMPAILREAMERAYEACGWSLKLSRNPGRFPTFTDLLNVLPQVVDSSAYSADTTNDYKGALVTRVRSLTRGIHGLIFQDDLDMAALLQEDAIIDLSRIGSQETKSLIMGILTLKLQEYRMSEATAANSSLRHVTVLEEAHNLLKRTSDVQVQESANLQGASVAMIASSIAEMRTYGEGFIIVDQSPGLLDPSVIRNTNTKIILRLPDKDDRELAGKAAGLTDEQIEELADLERGVAAVSQSGWENAVLCKVQKFEAAPSAAQHAPQADFIWEDAETKAKQKFMVKLMNPDGQPLSREEADALQNWQNELHLRGQSKKAFVRALAGQAVVDDAKLTLLRYLLHLEDLPLRSQVLAQARRQLEFSYGFSQTDAVVTQIINYLQNVLPEKLSSQRGE